jgi:hypothetical protein
MRIGAFSFLRLVVMLRRIWVSLDRLEDIEEKRLELERQQTSLEYPGWRRAGNKFPDPKNAKPVEIGVVDVEDLNNNWKSQHPDWD